MGLLAAPVQLSAQAAAATAGSGVVGAVPATAPAAFAHETSDLPADADVLWGKLPSGVRYAVLPHRDPPGRVSVRLLVKAGSLMETESQRGLAHFLEHMAFNGTTNYAPGELVTYLQRHGMGFGADTNAHTGMEETVYKLDMPHSDEATLRTGLGVMRDYADGILLLETEIDRERGVILSEKRSRDSAGYRSMVASWEFMFPEALLPQRMPIGLDSVISSAPRSEFADFYNAWYRPELMTVVVVGDVEAEQTVALIKELFDGVQARAAALPQPELGRITSPGLAVGNHFEREADATEVSLVSIVPDRDSPDTVASRELRLREAVVNEALNRRLQRLLQQPDAPFMGGVFYRYSYLDFFTIRGVEIVTQGAQWEQALGVAEQTLRQALEHGFSEQEIAQARAELLRSAAAAAREKDTRKSADISDLLVSTISNDDVFTSPQTQLELTQSALDGFGSEQALATLRQMWGDPNRWVFVAGTAEIAEPQQDIRTAYLRSAAEAVAAPQHNAEVSWRYTDFGPAGEVVAQSVYEPLNVQQASFANGVKFNFKQTDFQKGKVLVNVSIAGGDLVLPQAQPALALWADQALLSGGLTDLDYDQVQGLFAGKEVGISFDVAEDSFVFSGATSGEDLAAQLQLLAAYITNPGYRPEGEQAARRNYEQMELAARNTLPGAMRDEGGRFLSGGNYRFGLPARADFEALDITALQAWLEQPLKEGYLEVSIVGDISYEAALAAVAETFGALPQRQVSASEDAAAASSVAFPRDVREKTIGYAADEDRAMVLVFWPTVDQSDIAKSRRLSLLSNVLEDRLRVIVRQEMGEGYSPYSYHRASETYKDYGYLTAANIVKPESAGQIGEVIRKIGDELATGSISQDEMTRAMEPVLSFLKEHRRNNNYWMGTVLANSQRDPERLERAVTIEQDYASITIPELEALAAEYLPADKATILRVLPRDGKPAAAQ